MRFYIGVTDNEWFEYLAARKPDEVNFWQPSGGRGFRAIDYGAPFLFKLHSPLNYIVGGGFFIRHSILPLSLAWDAFGDKNGTPTQTGMRARVGKYRSKHQDIAKDPQVGCLILTEPFFFERDLWMPAPKDWSSNIVQGKTYDTATEIGRSTWAAVQERLYQIGRPIDWNAAEFVRDDVARYGAEYMARARLGQGTFRILVTEAYARRCAITGERTLPVLEAAHIKPFSLSGPNETSNGLLLRSDLHTLFDQGYMTVTPEYRVEVSQRIREEFENGRDYYAFHGKELSILPERVTDRPSRQFIEWHNDHVYAA